MLCKLRVVKFDAEAEELDSAPVRVTCNYRSWNEFHNNSYVSKLN